MKNTEYVICINTKNYGWCLNTIVRNRLAYAIKVMREIERENPQNQYKIVATDATKNWWNRDTR